VLLAVSCSVNPATTGQRQAALIGEQQQIAQQQQTAPGVEAAGAGQPAAPPATGLCLTGAEAERFLATAEVVEIETYQSKGITKPRRATLSDGTRACRAVFKDIDVTHDREQLTTGRWLLNLKDSYKHEIAAWKLDQLLGLGLVPPCAERTIHHEVGSLCMWVEGAMTEYERAEVKKIVPPNVISYNDQMHDIKLLLQLTWDTDYNNTSNILIDSNWKLYKVDSSRAFRTDPKLRREATLTRFRRRNVDALRSLKREDLDAAMTPWLDAKQIDGLWKRRGEILQRADNLIDLRGEVAVLYE
jgi:hypothetical protein